MKIKQSETQIIKRSIINFATYNPRKKDVKVVEALIKNFKKVGYLGGIVWNKQTGNLVGGHKRIEAMDIVLKYPDNDYEVKVEVIDVDDKTEKEQNIFLNNKRVQGDMDYDLLSVLIPEIDIGSAGLQQYDIDLCKMLNPNFNFGESKDIINDFSALDESKEDKKKAMQKIRKDIINDKDTSRKQNYFIVTFDDHLKKGEYLESIGINGNTTYINSDIFLQKINDL